MSEINEDAGAAALAALDHALEDRPDKIADDLAQAVRALVRLRDDLAAAYRRAEPRAGERLERCNAVLSVVIGGEYPLQGVRRERIEQARDELRALLRQPRRRGRPRRQTKETPL
ncbi:MAG TPA: hypothetical protein VJ770_19070 [Stellaceae bacterium]|nr:hypothetical protein [Stellaceae bacterium]